MSLDIMIYEKVEKKCKCGYIVEFKGDMLHSLNITHNLNEIAKKADIYECLWCIDENNYNIDFIIESLDLGLYRLKQNPNYFKTFDSKNKWGVYEDFVPFVEKYLNILENNKDNIKIEIDK